MAKVILLFPREGQANKRYWVVSKSDDVVDAPFIVVASESMSEHGVKFTHREGAMTRIYSPDKMQDQMLIEIVDPDRESVLKELRKRRIIKKVKPKEETKSGLDFI